MAIDSTNQFHTTTTTVNRVRLEQMTSNLHLPEVSLSLWVSIKSLVESNKRFYYKNNRDLQKPIQERNPTLYFSLYTNSSYELVDLVGL